VRCHGSKCRSSPHQSVMGHRVPSCIIGPGQSTNGRHRDSKDKRHFWRTGGPRARVGWPILVVTYTRFYPVYPVSIWEMARSVALLSLDLWHCGLSSYMKVCVTPHPVSSERHPEKHHAAPDNANYWPGWKAYSASACMEPAILQEVIYRKVNSCV
jgi:hypothetical protein